MKYNRLRLQKVYEVGQMDHDREAGKQWREEMTEWLKKRKALPLNPYHKPILYDEEGLEDDESAVIREAAMKRGDYKEVAKIMRKVRVIDLRMVDMADFLVVNLDISKVTCGTYEEIFLANRSKKPILIHCPQGIKAIPDWIFGTICTEHLFGNWNDLKEYLRHIDEDEDIDCLGRWKFFGLEPLIREVLGLPLKDE